MLQRTYFTIMGLLDIFLGNRNDKIRSFSSQGALILDVRTKKEFEQGHIVGSKNIPLQHLIPEINALKKLKKPIITCCASGMRSNKAAKVLKIYNLEVVNGGGWKRLQKKLQF